MLQDKNIFFASFVSSQIHKDGRVFYAKMTSCAVHYDVIYHPSLINSQYLNKSGVDSLEFDSPTGVTVCCPVSGRYNS